MTEIQSDWHVRFIAALERSYLESNGGHENCEKSKFPPAPGAAHEPAIGTSSRSVRAAARGVCDRLDSEPFTREALTRVTLSRGRR